MTKHVFSIIYIIEKKSGEWIVEGRAYADVKIGDLLSISSECESYLRVIAISSYGKQTDLLSTMMTGMLHLQGDISPKESNEKLLYGKAEGCTK
jgi:hypothetical protein